MNKFIMLLLVIGAGLVLLAGCSSPSTEPAAQPGPTEPAGYPDPNTPVDQPVDGYPQPGEGGDGIAPGEPYPGNGDQIQPGIVYIDSVMLNLMESFPLQLSATVSGNFADGCTYFDTYTQENEGNMIRLDVLVIRPADQVCTEALEPFTETLPVDIQGLPAGEYEVVVNGAVSETFTLSVDNVAPSE